MFNQIKVGISASALLIGLTFGGQIKGMSNNSTALSNNMNNVATNEFDEPCFLRAEDAENSENKNLTNKVNIIVTADHGFVKTSPDKVIDLEQLIDKTTYPYNIYSSSPMLNIVPKGKKNTEENWVGGSGV